MRLVGLTDGARVRRLTGDTDMTRSVPVVFVLGFVLGLGSVEAYRIASFGSVTGAVQGPPQGAQRDPTDLDAKIERLESELKQIKEKLPSQSHTMMDVDYHFTNLWFAAHNRNWPLAEFYWGETRQHLRWAVRVIPVRKDNKGNEIRLDEVLQAVEASGLAQLKEAIAARDLKQFEQAYRFTLESCYACHKASDKPYLRPRVPVSPATSVVNFDPQATWPH